MKAIALLMLCSLLTACQTIPSIEIHTYGGVKEPTYPPYCWVQPPGGVLWYPCDSEDAKLADCVNLMELAMKAVDPYVPSIALLKAMPILDEGKEKGGQILKLWDRAKNSCWSDLKDARPQHYH